MKVVAEERLRYATRAELAQLMPKITTLLVLGRGVVIYDMSEISITGKGVEDGRSIFGAYLAGADAILWRPGTQERNVRALVHELLHAIDDAARLRLTHDQIRGLAAGLTTVLGERANSSLIHIVSPKG